MFDKEKRAKNKEKKYFNLSMLLAEHMKDEYEYDYFNKLYFEVKEQYLEKLKDKNFSVEVERARLESKAGKLVGNVAIFSINIGILAMSILATGLLQAYSLMDSINKTVIVVFIAFAMFGILYFLVLRDNKNREIEYICHFCLRVLDDIEKEKRIIAIHPNSAIEEVAATTEDNKEKEQIKHYSNSNNGNWSVNISSLSVIDIVAGTYKAIKFINRLVKKKKVS